MTARQLLVHVRADKRRIDRAIDRHRTWHGCAVGPVCPIDGALLKAWSESYDLLCGLDWLLDGVELPAGAKEEWEARS